MTQLPNVTLCIINHNGAEHLRAAFGAIRAQSWPFAEILLIDNASDDSSLDARLLHHRHYCFCSMVDGPGLDQGIQPVLVLLPGRQ